MTVLTDLKAIAPTATAKAAFNAAGSNITNALLALEQGVVELQAQLRQVLSFHPKDAVMRATVNAGGGSGTAGLQTVTGTTGTGVKFTARGIVSGGALTGPLTIVSGGSYTADPTLTGEAVTGGGLTGCTLNLTMTGDLAVYNSLNSILSELL
jgi:hypothetical protein